MIIRKCSNLAGAFAAEAWQWLQDNASEYADALRLDVESGATAEEVRAYALRVTEGYRGPFVNRLKLAAEHLITARQRGE